METGIAVLLPAKDIPLLSLVTYPTGTKIYTLRDKVRVFAGKKEDYQEIRATHGSVFMVQANGDANATSGDTIVCWRTDYHTLQTWLGQKLQELS